GVEDFGFIGLAHDESPLYPHRGCLIGSGYLSTEAQGTAMSDPIEINRLNWDERALIHARDTTGDYMLDRFRAGEDALHEIDAAELGDIKGKRVLHLQCHIGRDTLCLVRRGAIATGLDFSAEALKVSHCLSKDMWV